MAPEHRLMILQGAEEKSYAAGEVLFTEGQPANRLFLLHEGQVALETHVPAKGDVQVAAVAAGQLLGWSWLVPPFVWHFQGRALEPVKSTVLNGAHLLVASEQNHFLGYELMKGIRKVILDVLLVAHQRWLDIGHPVVPLSPAAPSAGTVINLAAPLLERLGEHPFFHGMKREHLETVAGLASRREFEAGQLVLQTGALADGLYVLEAGTLRIESPQAGGARPVQLVPAGGAVGWSSFCEPYEWHFDVRAIEPASMLFFKAADLRERCAGDYHFAYELTKRITRMMLQHLQSTRHRMWEAFR
jgi:CRP-like cAMP-binding protein